MKTENLSLAEIVILKPGSAPLLESYGLDYCCHGKQKFSDVLAKDPLRLSSLSKQLDDLFDEKIKIENDFNSYTLSALIEYILNFHHKYVKEIIPVIRQHLEKVDLKHGDNFPYIKDVRELFNRVSIDLEQHMMKEENILFPRIKALEESFFEANPLQSEIDSPIKAMELEHETVGNMMAEIKRACNNYTASSEACTTHRLCIDELKMFEMDLHKHVHLENNILFPKALELERKVEKFRNGSGLNINHSL